MMEWIENLPKWGELLLIYQFAIHVILVFFILMEIGEDEKVIVGYRNKFEFWAIILFGGIGAFFIFAPRWLAYIYENYKRI